MTLSEANGAESCPLWYDPTRFYEGVAPRFDLVQQVVASGKVSGTYFLLFAERLVARTLSIVALLGFGYFSWRGDTKSWLINWLGACIRYLPLLLPALTGFGLYLVVGHAEGRLVGPFVVLLGVGLLATIRLPHPRQATGRPFGVATLACLMAILGGYAVFDVANAWSAFRAGEGKEAHLHYHVARQLQDLGLEPGEKVASIGFTYNAYWARLGGFGVLAEMPMKEASRFWASSPSEKTRVLNACRLAGARAVVCDSTPQGATGWRPVPGTTYAVRLLLEDEKVTRDVAGAD